MSNIYIISFIQWNVFLLQRKYNQFLKMKSQLEPVFDNKVNIDQNVFQDKAQKKFQCDIPLYLNIM